MQDESKRPAARTDETDSSRRSAGRTLLRALVDLAAERDDIREALRTMTDWLAREIGALDAADRRKRESAAAEAGGASVRDRSADRIDSRDPRRPRDPQEFLETGRFTPPDLGPVPRRARLKADACRWAIHRRALVEAETTDFQTEIAPHDRELAERASSIPETWLWMLDPYRRLPDDEAMELIASSYETLALAVEKCIALYGDDDAHPPPLPFLRLLAEAQNTLRNLLRPLNVRDDTDQFHTFHWLRYQNRVHQVYIDRYMRLNDPADPNRWPALQEEIRAYSGDDSARRSDSEKERRRLLNTISFEIDRLADDEPRLRPHHWARIDESLLEWVSLNLHASDPELCEMLASVADDIPEQVELSNRAREVFRYVDQRRRVEEQPVAREEGEFEPLSEEVKEAADLLRGRNVVLIGGEERPESRERLQRDLQLNELRWLSAKEHESTDAFEPHLRRGDVALALLAVRWTSHSHGDLTAVCRRCNVPFVRLPGGYGSNQVAHQIMSQASEQLARTE